MSNRLKSFMPTMGTGPRSSEALNYEQARDAMQAILEGSFEPATFGGFMVAERWKGQEPEELAGFLDELRSRDQHFCRPTREDVVDVAGRFDGKVNTVNTDLASSIVAAACGVAIVTHAGRDVPTKHGTTLIDVAEALGWSAAPPMDDVERALDELGFAYANASVYAPHLHDLLSLRAELGVRCFLNTLESMMNPAGASTHVGSFYHLPYARRVCETFDRSRTAHPNRVLMIQGMEGQTELRPGVSMIGVSEDGTFEDREIRADDLELDFDRDRLEAEGPDPEQSARRLVEVLSGEDVPEAYRNSVLLNAAVKLLAGGAVEDLQEGRDRAEASVQSGEAWDFFNTLEEPFSRERTRETV